MSSVGDSIASGEERVADRFDATKWNTARDVLNTKWPLFNRPGDPLSPALLIPYYRLICSHSMANQKSICGVVQVCVNIMAGVFLAPLRGSDVVDHAHGPPVMAPGAEVVGATRSTVPLRELLCRREMVLFMAGITMFHLANAAMLPQLGYKMDQLYTYAKMNNETTTMNMMGIDFELSGKNSIGLVTIVSQVCCHTSTVNEFNH